MVEQLAVTQKNAAFPRNRDWKMRWIAGSLKFESNRAMVISSQASQCGGKVQRLSLWE